MFCDLVEAFEHLVVRTKSETGTPQVTTKALDAPEDAARFQIERGPVTFRFDGSAAGEHNGANGVISLLLFEGGTETVYTDVISDSEVILRWPWLLAAILLQKIICTQPLFTLTMYVSEIVFRWWHCL